MFEQRGMAECDGKREEVAMYCAWSFLKPLMSAPEWAQLREQNMDNCEM